MDLLQLFNMYIYLSQVFYILNYLQVLKYVCIYLCVLIQANGALKVWEYVMCTGGSVIHTAHYPNERHSHHILSRRKLCDHWSSASGGSQFKTCQSRSWLTPTIQTLVTETSFHWVAPKLPPNYCGLWLKNTVFSLVSNALEASINWIACSKEIRLNSAVLTSSVQWSVLPPGKCLRYPFISIHQSINQSIY